MNRRHVTAFLVILGLAVLSTGLLLAADESTATLNVKLSVRGMHCAGCVNAVKAALEGVAGVSKAEVSLEKNEATVTYAKEKVTTEDLIKAVEKAGFKASLQKDDTKKG